MNHLTHVFYSFEQHCIVDYVHPDTGCSLAGGKTQAQLVAEYGTLAVLPVEDAEAVRDAAAITTPARITREKFVQMLEVLPPLHWHTCGDAESFQLSELYTGQIAYTFTRYRDTYWTWRDRVGLPVAQLVEKARLMAVCTGAMS